MKIEKVNENQIRCTLTREDLASRELKISELAYGTEKAKNLFRDMMQQASFEFGFEAEDIPLMIEAIPLNAECIVLIITKVEDPEELDTRFSKFAPSLHGDEEYDEIDDSLETSDEVMDLFRKLHESRKNNTQEAGETLKTPALAENTEEAANPVHTFRFQSLQHLITVAGMLMPYYQGTSTLYKDMQSDLYLLTVAQDDYDPRVFNKTCNILSEYGYLQKNLPAGNSYMEEHFDIILQDDAIRSLAQL